MTLPAIYLLQQADGRARPLLEAIVRDGHFTPESWLELRDLVTEHRVLDRALARATEFANNAKRFLNDFPPTPELEALKALPDYVLARDR